MTRHPPRPPAQDSPVPPPRPGRRRARWIGLGIVAAVGLFFASLWIRARLSEDEDPRPDVRSILDRGELPACPDTPNCVSSQTRNPQQVVEPIALGSDPVAGFETLTRLIELRSQVVRRDSGFLHAAFRTRLFGFIDDVYLLLDEADGVAHVRSASRSGSSDLGANRARVEELRQAMRALLPPAEPAPIESAKSLKFPVRRTVAADASSSSSKTAASAQAETLEMPIPTRPVTAPSRTNGASPPAVLRSNRLETR